MNDNYVIWISYNKDVQISQYDLKEDSHHKLFAIHKPTDGENINDLSPVYGSLVTMYYVWKNNIKSDYVGFNSYDCLFNVVNIPDENKCQILQLLDFKSKTVYEQYSSCHNCDDINTVIKILDDKFGLDNKYTNYIQTEHRLIPNCCFLMSWDNFVKLCDFVFSVIQEFVIRYGLEQETVVDYYNRVLLDFRKEKAEYQSRLISFLGERLISAWIFTNLEVFTKKRKIAIVHHNTPELTTATVNSINKHIPFCDIYIFDNSDRRPFRTKLPNVIVIDNTKRQIIDFNSEFKKYSDKTEQYNGHFGSAKHALSVEKLMDIIDDEFVLADSDILLKKNINSFFDSSVACVGMIHKLKGRRDRLNPVLCYINTFMIRENGIQYFDGNRIWALSLGPNCKTYDTGASFYEDLKEKNLPIKLVNVTKYMYHFDGATRLSLRHKKRARYRVRKWLKKHRDLWR